MKTNKPNGFCGRWAPCLLTLSVNLSTTFAETLCPYQAYFRVWNRPGFLPTPFHWSPASQNDQWAIDSVQSVSGTGYSIMNGIRYTAAPCLATNIVTKIPLHGYARRYSYWKRQTNALQQQPTGKASKPWEFCASINTAGYQNNLRNITISAIYNKPRKSIDHTHRNPFDSSAACSPFSMMLAIADHCLFLFTIPSWFHFLSWHPSQWSASQRNRKSPYISTISTRPNQRMTTVEIWRQLFSAEPWPLLSRTLSACETDKTDAREIQTNFSQSTVQHLALTRHHTREKFSSPLHSPRASNSRSSTAPPKTRNGMHRNEPWEKDQLRWF